MRISRYVLVASSMFEEAIGYKVHYEEGITTNVGQPRGRQYLIVDDHLPIKEIHEVKLNDTVIDDDKYELSDAKLGYIRRTGKRTSWDSTEIVQHGIRQYSHEVEPAYEITYDAGYVTPYQAEQDDNLERDLPHDIEAAVIDMAVMLYNEAGQNRRIQSASTGDWSYTLKDTNVPALFEHIVDQYKKVFV